jgi:hypothetical protein
MKQKSLAALLKLLEKIGLRYRAVPLESQSMITAVRLPLLNIGGLINEVNQLGDRGDLLGDEFGMTVMERLEPASALWEASNGYFFRTLVRCAFFGRYLHSRMPLDPTHVRLKRTCV